MTQLNIYRILSYILITIAIILGIAVLLALLLALANPALLLSVFVAAAVVLYSFSSFLFLINGIDGKRKQKPKLKDFIKVNAYVAVVFAVMNVFQAVSVIANPSVLNEVLNQAMAMQKTTTPLPMGFMLKILKGMVWFLLFYGIVLIVHIQLSFSMIRKFGNLFDDKQDEDSVHPRRVN